jgi:hypothetical protein
LLFGEVVLLQAPRVPEQIGVLKSISKKNKALGLVL